MGLVEATLEAAKTRLRPIVMTSLAFGFGVLPLALATGAGAGAQTAIGTSVLGGMITAPSSPSSSSRSSTSSSCSYSRGRKPSAVPAVLDEPLPAEGK